VRIEVNGVEHLIEATTTAAELFERIAPGSPREYWLLSRTDGRQYVENPQRKDTPIADLLADDPVALVLVQPRKCRHSSPEVPNRGFLCGWC
jgi:hypothetical protein